MPGPAGLVFLRPDERNQFRDVEQIHLVVEVVRSYVVPVSSEGRTEAVIVPITDSVTVSP